MQQGHLPATGDPGAPGLELSVIVTVVAGPGFLRRCLEQLLPQVRGRAVEILVPCDTTAAEIADLRERFAGVTFIDLANVPTQAAPGSPAARHELYDRGRALGLARALGRIVALVEDYEILAGDWLEQVLEAHRLPHGVIGGAVEHAGRGWLNWAVYWLDFGRFQRPFAEGPADYVTDVNVSYKRSALERVRPLWSQRYHEVTVHWALAQQGIVLWRRPQIVVSQDRGSLRLRPLLAERFAWGRLFGTLRVREISRRKRLLYLLAGPVIPLVLLKRLAVGVFARRRERVRFCLSLPLLWLLATAWCLGEMAAYWTGCERRPRSAGETNAAGTALEEDRLGGTEGAAASGRHHLEPASATVKG